jgi:hypothetical protein
MWVIFVQTVIFAQFLLIAAGRSAVSRGGCISNRQFG